jgi:hypothetical protein
MEELIKEETPKVNWVDIDVADNGYIVSYSVKEKKLGASPTDHVDYQNKKMLFEDEGEAFDFFVKMKKAEMKCRHDERKGNKSY